MYGMFSGTILTTWPSWLLLLLLLMMLLLRLLHYCKSLYSKINNSVTNFMKWLLYVHLHNAITQSAIQALYKIGHNHFKDFFKDTILYNATWVRIKSCQPDFHFLEQINIAGGATTIQLGTDVVDLDSGDFPDVTSSDVEDDVNLCQFHLQHLMTSHPGNHQSQGLQHQYPPERWWFHPQCWFAPQNVKSGWQDLILTRVTNPDE